MVLKYIIAIVILSVSLTLSTEDGIHKLTIVGDPTTIHIHHIGDTLGSLGNGMETIHHKLNRETMCPNNCNKKSMDSEMCMECDCYEKDIIHCRRISPNCRWDINNERHCLQSDDDYLVTGDKTIKTDDEANSMEVNPSKEESLETLETQDKEKTLEEELKEFFDNKITSEHLKEDSMDKAVEKDNEMGIHKVTPLDLEGSSMINPKVHMVNVHIHVHKPVHVITASELEEPVMKESIPEPTEEPEEEPEEPNPVSEPTVAEPKPEEPTVAEAKPEETTAEETTAEEPNPEEEKPEEPTVAEITESIQNSTAASNITSIDDSSVSTISPSIIFAFLIISLIVSVISV